MNWSKELKFLKTVRIKATTKDHINIFCPICGEGKSKNKARGYVLKEKDNEPAYYYCHNDPDNCSGSFGNHLLKHLGYQPREYFRLFHNDKLDDFKSKKKRKPKKEVDEKVVEDFLTEPKHPLLGPIKKSRLSDIVVFKYLDNEVPYRIIPIMKDKQAVEYIKSRGLDIDCTTERWFYIPKIHHIMIPFYIEDGSDEIYGFQTRSIFNKQFHIELLSIDNPKIYNIEKIVKNKPLYIFESIFNLLSYGRPEQSIAVLGSKITREVLKYIHKDSVFILDPDEAGKSSMLYYMDLGYRVVKYPSSWNQDINDMLVNGMSKQEIQEKIDSWILKPSPANSLRMRLKSNKL